jgi:hypothetical protein
MAVYRLGSLGAEVRRIQERLRELGLYAGAVDGRFGGGTDAAVRAYQKANRLAVDGVIGPETWGRLFGPKKVPRPAIASESLPYRCLALTGSFETGAPPPDCFAGLAGDFDGQGISVGVCQWNLGQKSLQPLLAQMDADHRPVLKAILGDRYPELVAVLAAPHEEQLAWARSIQTPKHQLHEPWRGFFKALGRTVQFQQAQVKAADKLFRIGLKDCTAFGLVSERAAALLFDIYVQNGGFRATTRAAIAGALARLPSAGGWKAVEQARMKVIANLRADASLPQWREDVRQRKLAIAEGNGVVHGRAYDLDQDYGLALRKVVA